MAICLIQVRAARWWSMSLKLPQAWWKNGTGVDTTSWALEDKIVFVHSLHP
jgi:hypothetical protein